MSSAMDRQRLGRELLMSKLNHQITRTTAGRASAQAEAPSSSCAQKQKRRQEQLSAHAGAATAARNQRRAAPASAAAALSLPLRPTAHLACCLLVLVLALAAGTQNNHRAAAFPSGAPESACKDLKPGHGGEAASGSSPFELTQDKLQVEAGDQIKVTLSSPSKTNFKGLIVQALNEKGEPKGKFLAGKGLKTLDSCSAVTHSDKEAKKTATLVWEAPAEVKAKEAFTFRATVVQKFDEFYMNIKSTLAQ